MLNRRQAALLRMVQDAIDRGHDMTHEEMKSGLGLKSRSTVSQIVTSLMGRGFLSWSTQGRRHLAVVRRIETIFEGVPAIEDPIVAFIHRYQMENDGVSPSMREVADGMGSSLVTTHRRIDALTRRGYLERPAGDGDEQKRQRMMRVVKIENRAIGA